MFQARSTLQRCSFSVRLHYEIQPHEIPHHIRTQAIGVLLVDLPTKNPLLLHHQLFTLLSLICFPYQPCDVSVMPMPCYEIISLRIPPWKTYGYFVLAVRRKGDRPQIRQLEGREWRKRTAKSVTGTGSSAIVTAHTVAEKFDSFADDWKDYKDNDGGIGWRGRKMTPSYSPPACYTCPSQIMTQHEANL